MEFILQISALTFGAIIGSFLNALSFRYNTGRSIAHGRSRCMQCGHELSALDLIPILSFVLLKARCRYCFARISYQYPMVELVAALLSLLVYLAYPLSLLYFFWFFVWSVLLFVVVYDTRHGIIPWACSLLLLALAIVSLLLNPPHDLIGYLAGPALALPLFLLSLLSKGKWMGFGDGMLELSLGTFLGLTAGITALVLAFWSGAVVGIVLMALSKRYTMRSELPFAPFLILGAGVVYFFHVDFFASLLLFF